MTDTDTDFSPTDAAGLAAWFARAESHAARLRRRLVELGRHGAWADPKPMPQGQKSDPVMSRAGGGVQTPVMPSRSCPTDRPKPLIRRLFIEVQCGHGSSSAIAMHSLGLGSGYPLPGA
jgi:hypothetical protein